MLIDFTETDWRHRISLANPPNVAETRAEIEVLQTMALNERPDALGEIMTQADEFISCFLALMGARPYSHPATVRVFHMANLVAILVSMHFKNKFNRARPSHLCPALLPPIEVPGHASYPSGHSTQAHLFADCAKAVLPPSEQAYMSVVLGALARRIARNREIAGLHYASDTAAGQKLAQAIFNVLNDGAKMPRFAAALNKARNEWI